MNPPPPSPDPATRHPWTGWILRHPRAAAALAAAATLAALALLPRLTLDNSIESWLDRDGEAWRQYQGFVEEFGSEEFVLVIYRLPATLDGDFLMALTDTRLDLEEALPGVRVFCLSKVFARFFGRAGIGAFEDDLARSAFYRNFLVSADRRWGAIWLLPGSGRHEGGVPMVRAVERALTASPLDGELRLAGSPVLRAALDEAAESAARTFFPLVFALSGVVLLLVFRSAAAVVVPFVSVGAGVAIALAALAAAGGSLNMVTVALPPVVWVLGLSTSIHLMSRWRHHRRRGEAPEAATAATLEELARPCLASAVTTAAGFASLAVSSLEPVRDMGRFSALGVLACLATNFLLFPLLASLLRAPAANGEPLASRIAAALGARRRRPQAVLAASALLAAAAALAATRLHTESNVVAFFAEDTEISRTYNRLLPEFTGPYSLEVVLEIGGEAPTAADLARLHALGRDIARLPQVAKVLSAADLVARTRRLAAGGGEPNGTDLELAWEAVRRDLPDELALLWRDGLARVSILARALGSNEYAKLEGAIRRRLEDPDLAAWRPRLTGIVDLLVDVQRALITSQLASFGLAFLLIAPVIGIILRSARYAALSIGPNLWPVLIAFGLMGALGLPLDPATVMIAAIALGIAVNDTIHFLAHYQAMRQRGLAVESALGHSLARSGGAMVTTSVVAALGFAVLAFSDFLPLVDFGALTAIALGAALFGDVVLLPAILRLADGNRGESA